MARWFWYLSPQKVSGLKRPTSGWGFLVERLGNLEVEAGTPWAKLKSKETPDPSIAANLEKVEEEIRKNHEVPFSSQIESSHAPLFFEFNGKAGRLVLRESYKGEGGDCVFLMAGIQEKTGVILLGSGSNVFGSSDARPRYVNPSIDPVGALLVHLDVSAQKSGDDGYPRAGIARDAGGLSLEEVVLYSFASALQECQTRTFLTDVHALAVFTAQVETRGRKSISRIEMPNVDKVVIGSPIYVEQMEKPTISNKSVLFRRFLRRK